MMDQLINLKQVTCTSKRKYKLHLTENLEFFLKNTLICTIKMPSLNTYIYSTIFNLKAPKLKKNFCINFLLKLFVTWAMM